MTRDAEHTPSPQSVVVPVEPTEAMLVAPDEAGVGLYSREVFAKIWSAMLAAAPAPSSLAGGEITNEQIQSVMLAAIKEVRATVTDATEGACMDADIIRMEGGLVDMGVTGWAFMRAVHQRLAALSPEAPAREGTAFAMNGPMTTHPTLRSANIARQVEWDQDGQITASYRGNELAGEVGEACNVIKKLERERLGILGSRATVDELADELADVLICADLIAMHYGIDLEDAVARKFNATSEKVGLRARLAVAVDKGEA